MTYYEVKRVLANHNATHRYKNIKSYLHSIHRNINDIASIGFDASSIIIKLKPVVINTTKMFKVLR